MGDPTTPPSLLTLPAELRLRIYEQHLPDCLASFADTLHPPALLQTSRQIQHEFAGVFYGSESLKLDAYYSITDSWCPLVDARAKRAVLDSKGMQLKDLADFWSLASARRYCQHVVGDRGRGILTVMYKVSRCTPPTAKQGVEEYFIDNEYHSTPLSDFTRHAKQAFRTALFLLQTCSEEVKNVKRCGLELRNWPNCGGHRGAITVPLTSTHDVEPGAAAEMAGDMEFLIFDSLQKPFVIYVTTDHQFWIGTFDDPRYFASQLHERGTVIGATILEALDAEESRRLFDLEDTSCRLGCPILFRNEGCTTRLWLKEGALRALGAEKNEARGSIGPQGVLVIEPDWKWQAQIRKQAT